MTWKIALRHLSRHWRLNLILLIVLVLGAALLASLPMLAITIAGESLAQSLQSAPIQARNLIIHGNSRSDEPPQEVEQLLDDLLQEIMTVRAGNIVGFPIISKANGEDLNLYPATLVLNMHSFDRLEERVQVLEGHLPESKPVYEDGKDVPIYEAVIGADAAHRSGLALGDQVSPAGGSYQLRIVGIVSPLHPDAEIWWEDSQMLPFSAWRRIYISPDIDEWNISLLVTPQTMISRIHHAQYWRIILDTEKITALNAPAVHATLIRLQSDISKNRMILNTELVALIERFEEELSLAQVSLLLLTFQSLVAVFYLLGMFGNFLVEQSRMELATMSGRGFSNAQITAMFGRAVSLLALLAGLVAPWVAHLFLVLWADWQGYPRPNFIPVESWWLALSTVLFSWVFLVISVYRSGRRDLLPGQGGGIRFDARTLTKRHPIWDIFILTLGGLAYWQLVQGSTITRGIREVSDSTLAGIADPILLLGPSLLLLALGLILLRLLPFLWRLFARMSHKARGLLWMLGSTRLARQPDGPNQITLLITLTAGLTFFAAIFNYSIDNWQQAMAHYVTGADIRLSQPLLEPFEPTNLVDKPGITALTQVIRTEAIFLVNEYQRLEFDLLAVDPTSFPKVVSYPAGISSYSISEIVGVLQMDTPDVLPIVIASNVNTHHLNIGDRITMEMGEVTYPLEIVGIIINFPLLDDVFAITDLSLFTQQVDLESMALMDQGTREMWLAVDHQEHDHVIAELTETGFGDAIAGNTQAQLQVFQNNLVFREVTTAFQLNALILIPLSAVGFFLIQLFSAQQRAVEFNILQALGFSNTQLRGLLVFEGLSFITLGMLVGAGIGFGLATSMQPFLSQILPPLANDFALNQIVIDWPGLTARFIALVGFYGFGLLVLMVSAIRNLRAAQL